MDGKDFDRLLKICRLRLADGEREKVKSDIDEIITYFNTIESVDCEKYSPAYHPVAVASRKRADKVVPFDGADKMLKNSKIYRFYIVGPKI